MQKLSTKIRKGTWATNLNYLFSYKTLPFTKEIFLLNTMWTKKEYKNLFSQYFIRQYHLPDRRFMWSCFFFQFFPSSWLPHFSLVQIQQLKHQNNKWNLFKVNNRDTSMTFHCWLWTSKYLLHNQWCNSSWVPPYRTLWQDIVII